MPPEKWVWKDQIYDLDFIIKNIEKTLIYIIRFIRIIISPDEKSIRNKTAEKQK